MKTLFVLAALVLSSSLAQAHDRSCEPRGISQRRPIAQQRHHHHHRHHRRMPAFAQRGSPELCQTIFASAQQARAVCNSAGVNWERARMGGATYTCSCGFDPSAPGYAFDAE